MYSEPQPQTDREDEQVYGQKSENCVAWHAE